MAQYAGLSLQDVYERKCIELHCKKNSAFFTTLPSKPDVFEFPTRIDLSKNFVGPKGLVAVMEVVRCCTGLTALDLRDQQLTNESAQTICDVLAHHPTVTHLDVSNNPITIEAGRALLDLARTNPRIEEIAVHNTGMRSVMTGAIGVQCSKNRAGKAPSAEQPAADEAAAPVKAVMDESVVRDALKGFPSSVAPYLFDTNVRDSLQKLCRQYSAAFIDAQFMPGATAIQRSEARDYGVVEWRRLSQIPNARVIPAAAAASEKGAAAAEWPLPQPADVDPSFSWVLTALLATARTTSVAEAVTQLIAPVSEVSDIGLYTVKFFVDGAWRWVVIDDALPMKADGTPAFIGPAAGTYYWPCLLLKAIAKLHGAYQAVDQSIANRHATERKIAAATTMGDFSGGVSLSRSLHHDGFDADDWWGNLLELSGAGACLVATTDSAEGNPVLSRLGVEGNHAYELLQARQVNGFRLIQLRSTFTATRWVGEWSAESPLWEQHDDVAVALDYKYAGARNAAAFWVPYLKFLQAFSAVHICRTFPSQTSRMLEGEWNRATAGGPYFESSWHTNPRYKLSLQTSGHVFVSVSLPDSRFVASEVDTLAFHVIRSDTYPLRYENVVAKTNYVITTAVSYEGIFSADGDVWIVPSSYMTGTLGRFFLRVVSSAPFSVSHEPMARYWTQRTEEVFVESSGEYQNGEDNPQYAIRLPADTHPARLMVQVYTPETEQLSLAAFLCVQPTNKVERLLGPIAEENVVAKSKFVIGNTVTLESSIAGGDSTFIVLPYVSPEGTAAKLQFRFWCSHPKFSLTPLPTWRSRTVECEWTRSGGYQDTTNNPQLELVTPIPNATFVIRVKAIGATDPSLIFFIANNHGRLGDGLPGRIPDEKVLCKSTYIRHHTAVKEFNNGPRPRDSYIIVPCLQPPGSSAKCVVSVSSPIEDFELRLLPPPAPDAVVIN